MSRRRFNKKTAQTFSVVHRAHDDELYFDNEASEHVLVPVTGGNKKSGSGSAIKKVFKADEIEEDVKAQVRENEGLAAQYGIYYDDSKYDYMQHLKPIKGDNDAVFIAANESKDNQKSKPKANIEELFEGQLPSKTKRTNVHKNLQDIPDELKGFNPNLDPNLREVLEALENEEYLERDEEKGEGYEDDDDDLFNALLASGQAEDEYDEDYYYEDGDYYDDDQYDDQYDEWDLDNYDQDQFERPEDMDDPNSGEQYLPYNEGEAPEEAKGVSFAPMKNTAWEKDFNKFKAQKSKMENTWDSDDEFDEDEDDVVAELPTGIDKGKKKSKTKLRKKKGAMSDTSAFSMSSSALFRNEGLTLLDDQFEQVAKKYEDEEKELMNQEYEEFDMLKERGDLEEMLDDFLENYELESGGRKLVKKDEEKKRIQEAADSVSKSKTAARRKKEKEMGKLGNSFAGMALK